MSDFKKNVVSGISWSFVNQIAAQVLNLLITIVLVRFISPKEFGILGMVTVLTGFAYAFLNFGFAAALIQKDDVSEKDIATVFFISITSGLFLYALFFLGAGPIARFYDKPELVGLVRYISLNFLILSFGIVQSSILIKKLAFKKLAQINIFSILVAGTVAITMATKGYGIWCLVIQSLLLSSLSTILLVSYSGIKVRFGFDKTAFLGMFNFGGHAAADSMLGYWARNLDNLLIGKYLGDISLGLYSKAYSIMLLPLVNFSQVISKVLFPSFSSIQQDHAKIKHVYLKVTRIIAFVTFPLMLVLWALSENFVLVVFGEAWQDMIPLLKVLCWLGIPQSILTLNGSLYHALGRADLAFRVGLLLKANIVIGLIAGLYMGGLMGLVIGYAIAGVINFYPSFFFAGRLVSLYIVEQLRNLTGVFFCALAAGGFTYLAKRTMLLEPLGNAVELILLTIAATIIYLLLLLLFKVAVLQELKVEGLAIYKQKITP
ncbi:MAG: MOP flippase family protein [Rhodothermales bacterium]